MTASPAEHSPAASAERRVVVSVRALALLTTPQRLRRLRVAYRPDVQLYSELHALSAVLLGYVGVTRIAVATVDGNAWIMTNEAAQRLGVKPAAVRRMLREGRIRGTRRGTIWLVDAADVARREAAC